MSVYKKLQQAKVDLQAMPLKKSGHNKFAGYQYFEIGDFLPQVNQIFHNLGLCSVVSFTAEMATLAVYDTDSGASVLFSSPMVDSQLKGCLPIQSLGAVEMYQRRYLYQMALDIVEHDAIDATVSQTKSTPNADAGKDLPPHKKNLISDMAIAIKDCYEIDDIDSMIGYLSELKDVDEELYLWSLLSSDLRSTIKTGQAIANAKTLESLKATWDKAPKHSLNILLSLKDKRKTDLSKQEQGNGVSQ